MVRLRSLRLSFSGPGLDGLVMETHEEKAEIGQVWTPTAPGLRRLGRGRLPGHEGPTSPIHLSV